MEPSACPHYERLDEQDFYAHNGWPLRWICCWVCSGQVFYDEWEKRHEAHKETQCA